MDADREASKYMLKAPSQLEELLPPMFPSLHRAPDHPTPLHPFATSPVPVMFGPNISGIDNPFGGETGYQSSVYSGAFYFGGEDVIQTGGGHRISSQDGSVHFDASRSSGLYGAASTVQPSSVRFLPVIKS